MLAQAEVDDQDEEQDGTRGHPDHERIDAGAHQDLVGGGAGGVVGGGGLLLVGEAARFGEIACFECAVGCVQRHPVTIVHP